MFRDISCLCDIPVVMISTGSKLSKLTQFSYCENMEKTEYASFDSTSLAKLRVACGQNYNRIVKLSLFEATTYNSHSDLFRTWKLNVACDEIPVYIIHVVG